MYYTAKQVKKLLKCDIDYIELETLKLHEHKNYGAFYDVHATYIGIDENAIELSEHICTLTEFRKDGDKWGVYVMHTFVRNRDNDLMPHYVEFTARTLDNALTRVEYELIERDVLINPRVSNIGDVYQSDLQTSTTSTSSEISKITDSLFDKLRTNWASSKQTQIDTTKPAYVPWFEISDDDDDDNLPHCTVEGKYGEFTFEFTRSSMYSYQFNITEFVETSPDEYQKEKRGTFTYYPNQSEDVAGIKHTPSLIEFTFGDDDDDDDRRTRTGFVLDDNVYQALNDAAKWFVQERDQQYDE